MLHFFKKHLQQKGWQNSKIIVAVSGGADSMALAFLLHQSNVQIAIAHCNFGLRNKESDEDEQFVSDWAKANNIPCFVKHFELQKSLSQNPENIQLLARNLRYVWFEQLRTELQYDFIAVAHHKLDSVETLLYNLLKGTGISGLHGIRQKNDKIIRPLLEFSKTAILEFCRENNITWREDSSNKKDDYTRNNIRHNLIPLLDEIVPNATENLFKNIKRFEEVEMIYFQRIEQIRKKVIEKRNNDYYIPVNKIKNYQPLYTILYELLKPFSFSSASIGDVIHLLDATTGKQVISNTHRIIKDRNFLIITAKSTEESTFINVAIPKTGKTEIHFGKKILEIQIVPSVKDYDNIEANEAYFSLSKIIEPIILRPKKTGDYFYPLGMGMKQKKVSRFLIDQKIPLHEKENVWVIESNKRIAWVIGMRADERFRVHENERHSLRLRIKDE